MIHLRRLQETACRTADTRTLGPYQLLVNFGELSGAQALSSRAEYGRSGITSRSLNRTASASALGRPSTLLTQASRAFHNAPLSGLATFEALWA